MCYFILRDSLARTFPESIRVKKGTDVAAWEAENMSKIRKILITGAVGMVGRTLVKRLAMHFELLTPTRAVLDLLNASSVHVYLATHAPDLIIHCAGKVGGIQANIAQPTAFLYENMMMGFHLVNSAQAQGVPHLLNLGSSCMYPKNASNPLVESQVLTGELEPTNEGYALAKCAVARLCAYIGREDPHFHYKTLIPCNLYGPYDKFSDAHSHMIPAVIKKIDRAIAQALPEVQIWGDGLARREFMYTEDLARFIEMAIPRFEDLPDLINVGLGYDYTINDYYETIAKVLGFQGTFVHDLSKPSGMAQKLVDVQKQSTFGFIPEISLEEGVRQTYDYYKNTVSAC
jgi:GDP-L-fucose synthase